MKIYVTDSMQIKIDEPSDDIDQCEDCLRWFSIEKIILRDDADVGYVALCEDCVAKRILKGI